MDDLLVGEQIVDFLKDDSFNVIEAEISERITGLRLELEGVNKTEKERDILVGRIQELKWFLSLRDIYQRRFKDLEEVEERKKIIKGGK